MVYYYFILSIFAVAIIAFFLRNKVEAIIAPRLFYFALAIGLWVFWRYGSALLNALFWDWNNTRLAPSIGLFNGYNLYYDWEGGPLRPVMYTPLSYLIYTVVAIFPRPELAVVIATLLTLLLYCLPVAIVVFYFKKHRTPMFNVVMIVLWFLVITITNMPLKYVAMSIHPDGAALCFAGLSLVMMWLWQKKTSFILFHLAIIFSIAAFWSKQLFIAFPLVLVFWSWAVLGFRQAIKTFLFSFMWGILIVGSSLLVMNPKGLWIAAILVPGHHPWITKSYADYFGVMYELFNQLLILLIVYLPLIIVGWMADQRKIFWRWGIKRESFLFLLAAIFMLPFCVLGRIKYGGDVNHLSYSLYFLMFACIVEYLALAREKKNDEYLKSFKIIQPLFLSFISMYVFLGTPYLIVELENLNNIKQNNLTLAYQAAKQFPNKIYLPWQPLATLYVDKKLYHSDIGPEDREIAGYPVSLRYFKEHTPNNMQMVCYPPNNQVKYTLRYLPDYHRTTAPSILFNWECFSKDFEIK